VWSALAEDNFANSISPGAVVAGDALVLVALAFAVLDGDDPATALGSVLAARTRLSFCSC
jgi:hypothetical protein